MILETFIPTERLRPFVKAYVIVDCDETIVNSMFPDTSLVVGFRYKGTTKYLTDTENSLPFAVVAGLRKSIQLMKDDANTGNLLVIFNTAGATAFFKEPLHCIFGEVLPLSEFANYRALNQIEDSLCSAISDEQRIRIVERFLISKLSNHNQDKLVDAAIQIITANNGLIKVKELADKLFISIDAFEKRFRKVTGATPKQFSYIVRMNMIVGSINNKSLAQTALDAGYYDQAHFSKDFKLFTGQTPADFLKRPAL
ncbi:MAG: helix-turn-helix transcriptional regulator [Chitinophagaceae bacterium]